MKSNYISALFLIVLILISLPGIVSADYDFSVLDPEFGDNDAFLIMDENYLPIYSKNAEKHFAPASTLKVLTSLSTFHYLGKDYRFKTEFYLDSQSNLVVRGYGDPVFTSESISSCCRQLAEVLAKNKTVIRNIHLDDSYFESIIVPGVTYGSGEPYDAPIGALSANFNTVSFQMIKIKKKRYIRLEENTPPVHMILEKIRKSRLKKGRIVLSRNETSLYAGSLIEYFLERNGIKIKGRIISSKPIKPDDRKIFTYESPYSMNEIIARLLHFSNNFIANQLFVTIGAREYGAPGSLYKGVQAVRRYTEEQMCIKDFTIVEGSGISRQNRFSPHDMTYFLKAFEPYRALMKSRPDERYKTGTLDGVSTRVGYFTVPGKGLYPFVIFFNSPKKQSATVEHQIHEILFNDIALNNTELP
jgi:D-alanyl-D-alanine carboxypeptidase/D-alanyl-D-alanine-endopeptidase (penicillin-binding protein 4)